MTGTRTLYLRSPAKINLNLLVLGKRPDGFHELLTEMVMADLFDDMVLEKIRDPGIHLRLSGRPVDGAHSDNLAVRALELFRNAVEKKGPHAVLSGGFAIDLVKKIPVGAGLGGGSSNAATILWGANRMAGTPLTREEILGICRTLGSDVPFFLGSPRAIGVGRGDQLREVAAPKPDVLLFWNPEVPLSTAAVYGALDPQFFAFRDPRELTENERSTRINSLLNSGKLVNSLEEPAVRLCPQIGNGLQFLERLRPGNVRMTGSGPTVFARFPAMEEARQAGRDMQAALGGWVAVHRLLDRSPFPD